MSTTEIELALLKERRVQKKQRAEELETASKVIIDKLTKHLGSLSGENLEAFQVTAKELVVSIAALGASVDGFNPDSALKAEFEQLRKTLDREAVAKIDDKQIEALASSVGEQLKTAISIIQKSATPDLNGTEVKLKNAVEIKGMEKMLSSLMKEVPAAFSGSVEIAYTKADPKQYINVRLTDGTKFYEAMGGIGVNPSVGGGGNSTAVVNELKKIKHFNIPEHDEVDLTYNEDDKVSQVNYLKAEQVVATLDLLYSDSGKLINVKQVA